MVTIVKHEWHHTDVQYALEFDVDLLSEIYPDLDEVELAEKLAEIEDGTIDIEDVVSDAFDNDVDIEWEHQYDDMWTMRKGGYDVTYEIGDEDSWHHEPPPPEPTHKCSKCKFKGQSYDFEWQWPAEGVDGEAKKVCPYCDSDAVLTEQGEKEEKERAKWHEEWDKEQNETEEEFPPMPKAEWEKAIDELKDEVEYLQALEDFKNDEEIHQEIRDAFVKIIEEEGL